MAHRMQALKKEILLDVSGNDTVATTTTVLNGYLRGVKTKTPATVDSSATVTAAVTDVDGDSVYSKSGIAANTTNQDYFDTKTNPSPLEVPVAGTYTITTTFSAAQSTDRTTTVTLLVETLI